MQKSTKCTALRQGSLAALLTIVLGRLLLSGVVSADEFAIPPAPSAVLEDAEQASVEASDHGELAPTERLLLEVVDHEADGTSVVEVKLVFNDVERQVRPIIRDGRTIEQIHGLVTPVTETMRIRVPPGEEVSDYLVRLSTGDIEGDEVAGRMDIVSREAGKQSGVISVRR